ncbi:hypothetical protein Tco_1524079 [Tanacetum coccineum]
MVHRSSPLEFGQLYRHFPKNDDTQDGVAVPESNHGSSFNGSKKRILLLPLEKSLSPERVRFGEAVETNWFKHIWSGIALDPFEILDLLKYSHKPFYRYSILLPSYGRESAVNFEVWFQVNVKASLPHEGKATLGSNDGWITRLNLNNSRLDRPPVLPILVRRHP